MRAEQELEPGRELAPPPPARYDRAVLASLSNPRRSTRVRVDLPVDVHCGGETWQSFTRDFGAGGCSFVSQRGFPRDSPVRMLVQGRRVRETLAVEGRVAWAADGKVGVSFLPAGASGDPGRWLGLLLDANPQLQPSGRKIPDRLTGSDAVVRRPAPEWRDVDLSSDEMLLLARMNGGTAIAELAARTQLAAAPFTRALFALLDKGVIEAEGAPEQE